MSMDIMRNPKTNNLKVGPEYDEILFLACCELLMRNSLRLSEIMYYFMNGISQDKMKTWNTIVEQTIKDITVWLDDLREKYASK